MATSKVPQLEERLDKLGLWMGRKTSSQGVQDTERGGYFRWHIGHTTGARSGAGFAPHKGFRTLADVERFIDEQEIMAEAR